MASQAVYSSHSDVERSRRTFLDVAFDPLPMGEILKNIIVASQSETFRYIVTPNVDHVLRISRVPSVAALYEQAWLCLNDSRILQRLARFARIELPATPGADIVAALLSGTGLDRHTQMIIVGGEPFLADVLSARYGFTALGQHRPPMDLLRNGEALAKTVEAIEASGAHIVFLAVGSPQQEVVAAALKQGGKACGIGLCVGAALEFLAGSRRRAPRWMRVVGLEWAFRLLSEPNRLGRRYLIDGPKIFLIYFAYLRARRTDLRRG